MWFSARAPVFDRPEDSPGADDEERKSLWGEHRAARRAARAQRRHERLLRWRSRLPQFHFKRTSASSSPITENSSHLSQASTVVQLPIDSLKRLQLKTSLKLSAERAVTTETNAYARRLPGPGSAVMSDTAGSTDNDSWVSTNDEEGLSK